MSIAAQVERTAMLIDPAHPECFTHRTRDGLALPGLFHPHAIGWEMRDAIATGRVGSPVPFCKRAPLTGDLP